jgi:serine/threonine protein kinase
MYDDEDLLAASQQRIGTVLRGKYRIDRVLGVGGMAVVYAATHRNRKEFAVKVLHAELSVRRDIRARFLREGYVANSVNHPGVVAVLDDDVDEDGSAFLVMELLEGATVEALCWRSGVGIPVREALAIAHQLLDVLDAAHARAIVHRDIKPANLFVLRDGQVKVLDFGIARLRDAPGIQSTRAGAIIGTPGFMAPEQALAQGSDVDPRTDVWAVGATLFTMISRHFVHDGDNGRQMLIRAATVPARSLASVAPHAPTAVVELVAKALEFDKALRWESATAMREAVARVHGELFGAPTREHITSLFDETRWPIETPIGSESTEASPKGASSASMTEAAVARAPVPAMAAPSDVATTTARPVSNRRSGGAPGRARATSVVLVALAATLAGGGVVALFARRSPHSVASSAEPTPQPIDRPSVMPPRSPPAVAATGGGVEPSREPSAEEGRAESSSTRPAVAPVAAVLHAAPNAGSSNARRPSPPHPARSVSAEVPSAPPAAPAASQRKPLQIEFQ